MTEQAHLQKIFLLLFITLFIVFLYTFLHEGGHALLVNRRWSEGVFVLLGVIIPFWRRQEREAHSWRWSLVKASR